MNDEEHKIPVARLNRDMARASVTLTDQEARFLVDAYYLMQDGRKRGDNQVRAMDAEPHMVISWLSTQYDTLESQTRRSLDRYSDAHPVGRWMKSIYGIGPVIAAGLLAHIDIKKAPSVGHIWRYAGLDPTTKWAKNTKRPWNAQLKTLSWKIGQSFMKFAAQAECVYGHVYRERKIYEINRNESGANAATAAQTLSEKRFDKSTEAYKALITGKLPPAQIDARARRYAVKLFLSHLQCVWWFVDTKTLPPDPYAIAHKGHVDFIKLPCTSVIPGLTEALQEKGWA
jgi:Transposase IS116/IS110/IS902 family